MKYSSREAVGCGFASGAAQIWATASDYEKNARNWSTIMQVYTRSGFST